MGLQILTDNLDLLAELDDNYLATFLAIYRTDIAEERAQFKEGDTKEDADILVAIEFYLDDIESQRTVAQDFILAQSSSDAQATDFSVVADLAELEQQAQADHAFAMRLASEEGTLPRAAGNNNDSAPPSYEAAVTTTRAHTLAKLAGLWISDRACRALHPDSTDHDPDPEPEFGGVLEAECSFCRDRKPYCEVVKVPCGEVWCRDCIRELFVMACNDESLFPPRCCNQIIPVANVRIHLTGRIIKELEEKRVEFATTDRFYCANAPCSKFIPPSSITANVASCQDCNTQTCTFCKNEAHENECREDVNMQAVLDLAREQGWVRCGNCQSMVELKHGCFHMICRCVSHL